MDKKYPNSTRKIFIKNWIGSGNNLINTALYDDIDGKGVILHVIDNKRSDLIDRDLII